MSQRLTQIQTQRTEQQLRLSQQQLQLVRLLEMPIAEFEQQVKKELMDNPALEEGASEEWTSNSMEEASDEKDVNDTGIDPYDDVGNESVSANCLWQIMTFLCMLLQGDCRNVTICHWEMAALSLSIWRRR